MGEFFKMDEQSELDKGQVVFYYTAIKAPKGQKYPIYISFSEDKVIFHFNGYIVDNTVKEEAFEPGFDKEIPSYIRAKLELIGFAFSEDGNKSLKITQIPVSFLNEEDNPNKVKINSLFSKITAKKANINSILAPYINSNHTPTELFTLHLHNDKATQKELEETVKGLYGKRFPFAKTNSFLDFDIRKNVNNKSYRDLACFGKKQKGRNKISLRILLLDFLFDVYQMPNVFDASSKFGMIKHLLKSSPIIQAIAKKANFYYQIENYNENNLIFNFENNQYTKNLIQAQTEWLETLKDKESPKIIKEDGWFKDIETETYEVFKNKINNHKTINKKNNWFDDLVTETYKFFKSKINSDKDILNKYEHSLFENKTEFSTWFIKRNNILKAWFIFDKLKYIFYPSLIFLLYVIISIVRKTDGSQLICRDINIPLRIIIGIVIGFIVIGFIGAFNDDEKIKTSSIGKYLNFSKNLIKLWMLPLWMLIFTSAVVVNEITSYYNKMFIENDWTYQMGILIEFSLIAIIVYKSAIYFVNKSSKKKKRKANPKPINISFILSIIILLRVLIYYDLVIWNSVILYFILISTTSFILYNNDKEININLSSITSLNKTISMLFYGLAISFFVNIGIYNTLYKEYLEQYEYLGQIWENTEGSHAVSTENTEKINTHNKDKNTNQTVKPKKSTKKYIYTGDKLSEIHNHAEMPLSDAVKVYIDQHFFEELTKVHYVGNGESKKPTILKKINLNGYKFYTIPSVVFLNTFLSLLLAVIIQIILHRKKFLEGGEAE